MALMKRSHRRNEADRREAVVLLVKLGHNLVVVGADLFDSSQSTRVTVLLHELHNNTHDQ